MEQVKCNPALHGYPQQLMRHAAKMASFQLTSRTAPATYKAWSAPTYKGQELQELLAEALNGLTQTTHRVCQSLQHPKVLATHRCKRLWVGSFSESRGERAKSRRLDVDKKSTEPPQHTQRSSGHISGGEVHAALCAQGVHTGAPVRLDVNSVAKDSTSGHSPTPSGGRSRSRFTQKINFLCGPTRPRSDQQESRLVVQKPRPKKLSARSGNFPKGLPTFPVQPHSRSVRFAEEKTGRPFLCLASGSQESGDGLGPTLRTGVGLVQSPVGFDTFGSGQDPKGSSTGTLLPSELEGPVVVPGTAGNDDHPTAELGQKALIPRSRGKASPPRWQTLFCILQG